MNHVAGIPAFDFYRTSASDIGSFWGTSLTFPLQPRLNTEKPKEDSVTVHEGSHEESTTEPAIYRTTVD